MSAQPCYQHGRFVGEMHSPAWYAHLALRKFIDRDDPTEAQEAIGDFRGVAADDPDVASAVLAQYPWSAVRQGVQLREAFGNELLDVQGKLPEIPPSGKLRTLRSLSDAEILASNYVVKNWIDLNSETIVFGDSNAGKTFIVLDMLACIALGQPWHGARTKKQRVLYLGYEGKAGLQKRMKALREKYPGLDAEAFAWWPMRHPITSPKGHAELQEARQHFAEHFGGMPDVIAVDPLRNALGGSDSDADLVELLRGEIRALFDAGRCTVVLIHHVGHSDKSRERGDSGLRAGADSSIQVEKTGHLAGKITAVKQRDSAMLETFYRLRVVDLGRDADGDPVTTLVLDQAGPPEPQLAEPGPSIEQRIAADELTVLRHLARELKAGAEHSVDSLKRDHKLYGMKQADAGAIIARLEAHKRIVREPLERTGGRGRSYKLAIVGNWPEEGASGLF